MPSPHSNLKEDLMSHTALQSPARKHSMLTLTIDAWLDLEDPGKGSEVQRMNELLQGRGHDCPQPSRMWVWHVRTREKLSRQQHSAWCMLCSGAPQQRGGVAWGGTSASFPLWLLPRMGAAGVGWGSWWPHQLVLAPTCTKGLCQAGRCGKLLWVLGSKGERGICYRTPFHQWLLLTLWKEDAEYQLCLEWGKNPPYLDGMLLVCWGFFPPLGTQQNSSVFVYFKTTNSFWRKEIKHFTTLNILSGYKLYK